MSLTLQEYNLVITLVMDRITYYDSVLENSSYKRSNAEVNRVRESRKICVSIRDKLNQYVKE